MSDTLLSNIIHIISFSLAILMFYLGYRQVNKIFKRNNTISLLYSSFSGGPLTYSYLQMVGWIADGHRFVDDEPDLETSKALVLLLDFYNFLSVSALDGALDAQVVKRQKGIAMKDTYAVCEGYIIARRKRLGRPLLYSDYEEFLTKFVPNRV